MNFEVSQKLGSHTPIFSLRLKGWLFWQAWLSRSVSGMKTDLGANQRLAVCCTSVIDGGRGNASAAI